MFKVQGNGTHTNIQIRVFDIMLRVGVAITNRNYHKICEGYTNLFSEGI